MLDRGGLDLGEPISMEEGGKVANEQGDILVGVEMETDHGIVPFAPGIGQGGTPQDLKSILSDEDRLEVDEASMPESSPFELCEQ